MGLIATVIECCEEPGEPGPGHPPAVTVRVLATLRRFLRESTPWRSLRATPAQASGSTLRRRLAEWAAVNLLQRVHAVLVAMLRGDPDLILDSCSVRAKRGGDLVGPNPTDRGKRGTKYHLAVTGDGVPVACAATGANVNDTVLFERLFLTAFAVTARIATVFADKGYDAEANRDLCRTASSISCSTSPCAGCSKRCRSSQCRYVAPQVFLPGNTRPWRSIKDEIACRLRRRSATAASRERTRSRIASCAASGTHTAVSSPARSRRASCWASRRLVLT